MCIRDSHLTNNCREPGNYEFALIDGKAGKVWGSHISFDIEFYRKVLAELEVDYRALGTGVRVVGTQKNSDGRYDYVEATPKRFPSQCHLSNLAPYIGKGQRRITPKPIEIRREQGPIVWDNYSG